jgi:DHA1 family bicyclomycin/chloramphenicol resistance-like MFS transporter
MPMFLLITLASICLSTCNVAAGEQTAQTDLILLQTLTQVTGDIATVPLETSASSEPASKLRTLARAWVGATAVSEPTASSTPKPPALTIASICLLSVGVIAILFAGMSFYRKMNSPTHGMSEKTKDLPDSGEDSHSGEMSWGTSVVTVALILVLISATEQYTPQMLEMSRFFNCSDITMTATIQLNLFISAISSLIAGPLSDRVGRKPILVIASVLISVSSFACASANSIEVFLAARVLQGIAEGARVVIICIYRDVYVDPKERAEKSAPAIMCMLIGPMLAPSVGGFVTKWTGSWRYSFVLIGVIGVVLTLGSALFCDETLSYTVEQGRSYMSDARQVLSDRYLLCIMVTLSLINVQALLYGSWQSFVIEEHYHMSPVFFSTSQVGDLSLQILGLACFLFLARLTDSSSSTLFQLRLLCPLTIILASWELVVAFTSLIGNVWWYLSTYLSTSVMMPFYMNLQNMLAAGVDENSGMVMALSDFFQCSSAAIAVHLLSYVLTESSALATQMLVTCFILTSGLSIVFWAGFVRNPPAWAFEVKAQ